MQLSDQKTGSVEWFFPGDTDKLIMFFQFIYSIVQHCDLIRFQTVETAHREKGETVAVTVTFAVAGGESAKIFDVVISVVALMIVDTDVSVVRIIETADLLHPGTNSFHAAFRDEPDQDGIAFGFGELFVEKY